MPLGGVHFKQLGSMVLLELDLLASLAIHSSIRSFDGDLLALEVVQVPEQYLLPVAAVAYEPQV